MWSITVLTITALVFAHTNESHLIPKLDGRIVGGVDADISEFPYQLSLERNGVHCCGASILKSNVALTAAHCYDPLFRNRYTVRAGSSIRYVGGQVVKVRYFHIHNKYNVSAENDFDVAVVLLAENLRVGGLVSLPPRGYQAPIGTACQATGWGSLYEGDAKGSDKLQKVQLNVISQQNCYNIYRWYGKIITSSMICSYMDRKDSCQGDSGGPLTVNGVQIGIVSWGKGCARDNIPGVYTNIGNPEVHDFITSTLKYN